MGARTWVPEWLREWLERARRSTNDVVGAVFRQLRAALLLQLGISSLRHGWLFYLQKKHDATPEGQALLAKQAELQEASSYEDWKARATELDQLEGTHHFRQASDCELYDKLELHGCVEEMDALIAQRRIVDLMFHLRSDLARGNHGLLHPGLFSQTHGGTKFLVEEYQDALARALRYVADEDSRDTDVPHGTRAVFLEEASDVHGRTALFFSGGAAMAFYHFGAIKALLEHGLLPKVLAGSSAGAVVAAVVGTRTDEELAAFLAGDNVCLNFLRRRRESLQHPYRDWGIMHRLVLPPAYARPAQRERRRSSSAERGGGPETLSRGRSRTTSGAPSLGGAGGSGRIGIFAHLPPSLHWLIDRVAGLFLKGSINMDTAHYHGVLKANLGLYTFREAYERTGRILNIVVAPARGGPPRLLNHVNSPDVLVWSAAAASSARSGLVQVLAPTPLLVRSTVGPVLENGDDVDDGEEEEGFEPEGTGEAYIDGSMEAASNVQQLAELFNVNHFILSQANPYGQLVCAHGMCCWRHPLQGFALSALRTLIDEVRVTLKGVADAAGSLTNRTEWLENQPFYAFLAREPEENENVIIYPWQGKENPYTSSMKMLKNVTINDFQEMVATGERNTWPALAKVRSHCLLEKELERAMVAMHPDRSAVPAFRAPPAPQLSPPQTRTAAVHTMARAPVVTGFAEDEDEAPAPLASAAISAENRPPRRRSVDRDRRRATFSPGSNAQTTSDSEEDKAQETDGDTAGKPARRWSITDSFRIIPGEGPILSDPSDDEEDGEDGEVTPSGPIEADGYMRPKSLSASSLTEAPEAEETVPAGEKSQSPAEEPVVPNMMNGSMRPAEPPAPAAPAEAPEPADTDEAPLGDELPVSPPKASPADDILPFGMDGRDASIYDFDDDQSEGPGRLSMVESYYASMAEEGDDAGGMVPSVAAIAEAMDEEDSASDRANEPTSAAPAVTA